MEWNVKPHVAESVLYKSGNKGLGVCRVETTASFKNVVSISGKIWTQEMHYGTIVITLEACVFGIEPELNMCFVPNW